MHNPLFDLSGKTAFVTGAGQGIGYALAEGLASHGAKLIINGRNAEKAENAATVLRSKGFEVTTAIFDVTDAQAVRDSIDGILTSGTEIDILINNAGMQFRSPLEDFPIEQWEKLLATNVSSVFYVAQAVSKHMIARGSGKIVNIASVQSELARPGIAPYTATKGAIRNLTRGMATDWAKYGLQINAIAPGYFKTPLNQALVDSSEFSDWLEKRTPAGRWGEVAELVGAAVFLSSSASSFVNGQTLFVDGGVTASL